MTRPFLLLALAAGLAAPLSAQHYETIAFESFDYVTPSFLGGAAGGSGWADVWWSGNNGDQAQVDLPGFDAVGGKATTLVDNGGSWREIDRTGFDYLLSGPYEFGADNTTIWVNFRAQRSAGSDDDYGGLSLYTKFVGEKIFLGSPSFTTEWGLHDIAGGSLSGETVTGSSDAAESHLVYRLDFLPGDDRIRLWIDPASAHPSTTADLDVTVADFTFNEIRIQSGSSITATGFDFDEILIDTPSVRPIYSIGNLVAGSVATLDIINATPGSTVLIGYSVTGAGPTTTPFGDVAMSPPILQLPPQTADVNGEVHLPVGVPISALGLTLYTQAGELSGGGAILSNALAEVVQ
ncbi:MAG: hypothetical protein DWQ01_07895 [Planctomycetota bacterium]|nr:MAG: hypothetical protein DWQ01_07895 [Planctomycetota bacterium]